MVVSMAGQSYAAVFAGTENTAFTITASVDDRPASYDYAVKMFFEGDDPVLDGVDMAGSKNLNFQALKWEHGRWNGTFAWCLQFFMDAPVPYQLRVSSTGIVGATHGQNINESVIVTPHWAQDYTNNRPADMFIWNKNFNPATDDCTEANGCAYQDPYQAGETIVGYVNGQNESQGAVTVRESALPVSDIVAADKVIYSSGTTGVPRVMRAYVGIFNIEDGLTDAEIARLPGEALKDAPKDTYQGSLTFTMEPKG